MENLDPVILSRLQFTLVIMFHYLFPPLSIGLGWLMVLMEGAYLKTGDREYEAIARFWTGIFALVFAMGVASGIVMEFQFGTNWANYSRYVGDIFGSALAAEGIFAFFLESSFLALLVFGWDRVGPKMHFFSTLMVASGALLSSVWIVVANAWQQHPVGYHLMPVLNSDGTQLVVNGIAAMRAEITDFWAVVLSPSAIVRVVHVWFGAGILGSFFVLSLSSYYIIKKRHLSAAKKMFNLAMWTGIILTCGMLASGHSQAMSTAKTQPAKLAATEGHFHKTEGAVPFYIWGFPNQKDEKVHLGIAVPGGLSFLLNWSFDSPVKSLEEVYPDRNDWPPVALTFYTYHFMIGLWGFFFLVLAVTLFYWWKGVLWEKTWLLWVLVFSVIAPYISNHSGWVTTEVGRQPWVVYNLMRTADAVSPSVKGVEILLSILLFGLIYALLFCLWLYIMGVKIKKGPELHAAVSGADNHKGDVQ